MSDRIPPALRQCPLGCRRRFRAIKPENLRDDIAWHMVLVHGAQQEPLGRPPQPPPTLRAIDGGRS